MFIARGKAALVLAPMDGVTDALMRGLLTKYMPLSYCVTEFIRVSAIVPPVRALRRDVPEMDSGCVTQAGAPVQVQILGGDPELLAETATAAVKLGAQGIDLNFGCPAPTVNRHDGGATLLKFPDRIERIVATVRGAVPAEIPVSAKLRLGWDDPNAIRHNAARAARGGASWITIHGRTKTQGYTPPAYWKPIGEVRRELGIPVVANGEIWSVDDLRRCQDESGCEHFMIGRGALAEPGLVTNLARALDMEIHPRHIELCGGDPARWQPIILELIEVSQKAGEPERRTVSRVKQWLNYAHHKGAVQWFDRVKRLGSIAEIQDAIGSLVSPSDASDDRRAA